MEEYCFTVTMDLEDERLDKCISIWIDSLSRSYIQKIIKEEAVFVNDISQKASYRVKEDDKVRFSLPPAVPLSIEPQEIPLDILYEDKDVLVVNKPKGMVVHPAAGHYDHTLVNALLFHCREELSGINGVMRPGIVHRIDRDTTGSVIVCKNDIAHNCIAAQLKEHSIKRIYKAIVNGNFSQSEGCVNSPIGRNPNDRKKMAICQNGKSAVTHYKVLEQLGQYSYMEFSLETGRTHQIRVHMASIGHPLVGDTVYGSSKDLFHTQGQVLHAEVLGFIHPSKKEYIETIAPLPVYFTELLEKLRRQN